MEWKNDILSFSGFDYGVASKKQKKLTAEVHEQQSETKLFEDLDETELVDEPRKIETTRATESKEKCEFDPMAERKIENFYFRNVEQAERKLKMLSNLKSKMSVSPAGEEIFVTKFYLKPKNHENPWKDGTLQEKEVPTVDTGKNQQKHKRGMCILS
ncbi:unnamed protein product [Caenorhabditis nigoni]